MSTPTTTPMSAAASDVLQRGLSLDPAERAKVVDRLIESFDDGEEISQEEWEAAWAEEIERRAQAVEDGTEELIDGDEFMEKLRREIESRKQR